MKYYIIETNHKTGQVVCLGSLYVRDVACLVCRELNAMSEQGRGGLDNCHFEVIDGGSAHSARQALLELNRKAS